MSFTIAQLTTEINTDPKSLGYAAFKAAGDDAGLAALINSTYVGVGVVRRTVTNSDILKNFVATELATRTVSQLTIMQLVLSPSLIDTSNQNIIDIFSNVWTGTTTLTNLDTLSRVTAPSRAEELWGAGTKVSSTDVQHAMGR